MDEYQNGGAREPCEWVQMFMSHLSKSHSHRRYKGVVNVIHNLGEQCTHNKPIHTYNERHTTDVWQRVLWGSEQRVQGSNGLNAAQLSCLQATTLTFQLKVGVPCVIGLRHGVTMHPRGRHLRGVRTPLPHGLTNPTAREQQTPIQLLHNHHNQWGPWDNGIKRGNGVGPCRKREDISSRWRYRNNVFLCETLVGGALLQPQDCKSGELSHGIEPKRRTPDGLCESRLGPYRAQSNMVSQSDGDQCASV